MSRSDLWGGREAYFSWTWACSGLKNTCAAHEPALTTDHKNTLENGKAQIWKKLGMTLWAREAPLRLHTYLRTVVQILNKHRSCLSYGIL